MSVPKPGTFTLVWVLALVQPLLKFVELRLHVVRLGGLGDGRRPRVRREAEPLLQLLQLLLGGVVHGCILHLQNLALNGVGHHFLSSRRFALGLANPLSSVLERPELLLGGETLERLVEGTLDLGLLVLGLHGESFGGSLANLLLLAADGALHDLHGLVRLRKRCLETFEGRGVVRLLPQKLAGEVAVALTKGHDRLLLQLVHLLCVVVDHRLKVVPLGDGLNRLLLVLLESGLHIPSGLIQHHVRVFEPVHQAVEQGLKPSEKASHCKKRPPPDRDGGIILRPPPGPGFKVSTVAPGTPGPLGAAGKLPVVRFTAAAVQIAPHKGDVAANLERIADAAVRCSSEGADLAVFPETSTSGYFLQGGVADAALTAEDLVAELSGRLQGLRRPLDVILGFYERADEGFYNSAAHLACEASGCQVVHVHRKFFLPTYGVFDEERFVARGGHIGSYPCRFGDFAILICEDIWHSISATIAALSGAEALVAISASPARGFSGENIENLERYERLLRSISEEHGVWTINSMLVGFEGGKGFTGGSMIVDPLGHVVARGPTAQEHILMAEVDMNEVARARAATPLLSDLKSSTLEIIRLLEAAARKE